MCGCQNWTKRNNTDWSSSGFISAVPTCGQETCSHIINWPSASQARCPQAQLRGFEQCSLVRHRSTSHPFWEAARATNCWISTLPKHFMLSSVTANWWGSVLGLRHSIKHTCPYTSNAHTIWVCAVASRSLPGLGPVPGSVLGSPQNKEQLCSPGLLHGIQPQFTLCSLDNSHCSAF